VLCALQLIAWRVVAAGRCGPRYICKGCASRLLCEGRTAEHGIIRFCTARMLPLRAYGWRDRSGERRHTSS